MKTLILGSDGQIGRPLVTYLKQHSHSVVEFDNHSFPPNDLRVQHILNSLLPDIDFVFFLAFDVGGAVYLKQYQDSFDFISNNMKIMANTFDSLRRFNTPFLFASSQMSGMSHSTYGILKLIGERYTHALNGKVVKFWNVYGPEKDTPKAHVITHFISMAKRGKIEMLTSGAEKRQFLYVTDCCECMEILMNNFYAIQDKNFDVSSFVWTKIIDVAQIISDIFKCEVIPGKLEDDVQRNELVDPRGEILQYWQPTTNIIEGIKLCVNE